MVCAYAQPALTEIRKTIDEAKYEIKANRRRKIEL